MRTGADYRASLRDGRKVYILGEGKVEDVTTHPATSPMVEEYVKWYDRHHDPEWKDIVLTPEGSPVGYMVPRCAQDLTRMGRCFSATTFPTAGNITHTPAYGHMIALGVQHAVNIRNASDVQVKNAEAYRASIASSGRFLTFAAAAATIGYRLRPDPADRAALRLVNETDAGVVISGKIGMHTSPAYAEDVYLGANNGIDFQGHRATFIVTANAARRNDHLPQTIRPRHKPVQRPAQWPLRRTRRPDVAGQRADPVGARVPHRTLRRTRRPLAVLAPALLLAREGRIHPGHRLCLHPCDGPDQP